MRRDGAKLVPMNQLAEDDLLTVPTSKDLLVTIKTPRNLAQFNLGWALAQKCSDACDWLHDKSDAMAWLLIRARHVKYITDPRTGKVEIIPKSIALGSMKQDQFDRLFKRLTYIVLTEIIPGVSEATLRAELLEMIA